MQVQAHFLSSEGGTKNSDNWDLGDGLALERGVAGV